MSLTVKMHSEGAIPFTPSWTPTLRSASESSLPTTTTTTTSLSCLPREADAHVVRVSSFHEDSGFFAHLHFGGTVVCNDSGQVIEIDHHLLEPFGYTYEHEVYQKSITLLLPDYPFQHVTVQLSKAMKEDQETIATVLCIAKSKGNLYCKVEVIMRSYGDYKLLLLRPLYQFGNTEEKERKELYIRCTAFGLIRNVASCGQNRDDDHAQTFLGVTSSNMTNTSLMNYIHNDDVSLLCHHLNEAQKYVTSTFDMRLWDVRRGQFVRYRANVAWEAEEVICILSEGNFSENDPQQKPIVEAHGGITTEEKTTCVMRRPSLPTTRSWIHYFMPLYSKDNTSTSWIEEVDLSKATTREGVLIPLFTKIHAKIIRCVEFCVAYLSNIFRYHPSALTSSFHLLLP
jgi:hypothetical protein